MKYRSKVPPDQRKPMADQPAEVFKQLEQRVSDAQALRRVIPVVKRSIKGFRASDAPHAADMAQAAKVVTEFLEGLYESCLLVLDGYDERDYINDAQKDVLTAPPLPRDAIDLKRVLRGWLVQLDQLEAQAKIDAEGDSHAE